MEAKVRTLLEKHQLQHLTKDVLAYLRSCLSLRLERAQELPVGVSKMGGLPDLPPNSEFPIYKGRPLTFIAQYNLAELAAVPFETGLPAQGMLYFFYDADKQEVWGESDQKEGWRVIYFAGDTSKLRPASSPAPDYFMLSQCKIHFEPTQTLEVENLEEAVEITDEMEERYYAFLDDLHKRSPFHQAFGYPFAVQNEVFEECEWLSKQEGKEWVLLLQVDSDEEELKVMWGDVGLIYFCIPKDALEQARFEETWLIFQCH
jgi:uncharacterized protein YwqG